MNLIIKSVLGGVFIAISSYIYLQTGGIIGAGLFSIGLFVILNMQLKLFTGSIGYVKTSDDLQKNLLILLGNILGAFLLVLFPNQAAILLVTTKLQFSFLQLFIKSLICGMFIYSAVQSFNNKKDYMILVCILGFILFGAEHCIADLCYFICARLFSLQILLFLIIVTLGNSIGAILMRYAFDNK